MIFFSSQNDLKWFFSSKNDIKSIPWESAAKENKMIGRFNSVLKLWSFKNVFYLFRKAEKNGGLKGENKECWNKV